MLNYRVLHFQPVLFRMPNESPRTRREYVGVVTLRSITVALFSGQREERSVFEQEMQNLFLSKKRTKRNSFQQTTLH